MNIKYLKFIGVTLAGLTAVAHTFFGTQDTLFPLLETELSPAVMGTFHACWHFVSIFLVYSVWCFANNNGAAREVAILWILFGACFLLVASVSYGVSGLVILPQWVLLAPAGLLVFLSTSIVEHYEP